MKKKPTIKEVAQLAEVGTSSVSRYYNNGYVSEVTRRKIEHAIEELNYLPNQNAKALRGNSNEICVIVERITSTTASRFLNSLIKNADKKSYTISVYVSNFDNKKRKEIIEELVCKNVKKIIILAYNDLDYKYEDKIIVVGQKSKYYNSVTYDEKEAIIEALEFYSKKNLKEVQLYGFEVNDEVLAKRVEIVRRYCNEKNLKYDANFFKFDNLNLNNISIKENVYYFCMTDQIAHLVYFKAKELNKKIYVSGVGNYDLSSLIHMSSIDNNYDKAAQKVLDIVEEARDFKIKSKFIQREVVKDSQ